TPNIRLSTVARDRCLKRHRQVSLQRSLPHQISDVYVDRASERPLIGDQVGVFVDRVLIEKKGAGAGKTHRLQIKQRDVDRLPQTLHGVRQNKENRNFLGEKMNIGEYEIPTGELCIGLLQHQVEIADRASGKD